ncbi:unnamed protein product, partial [Echinostoma caproni]|uniref:Btz domain-containing protein n=1 Tax=Echinostoma caproni TaxID=27848 RepID=A0A183A142_9TREM
FKPKENTDTFQGPGTFGPNETGCTRDSSHIVLGPQKRTWNTGCHVSHPSGRDTDLYGSGPRGGKAGSDYRFPDRGSNDYKRDFRGGHSVSRDRGVTRRTDGVAFCQDRHLRDGRMSFQEEPEWFSEGPTTVSETIELGEFDDDASIAQPRQQSDEVACVGDRKSSTDNVESELEKESDLVSTNSGVPVTTISHLDLFDALQIPKTTTSQGSRFKHLFAKSEREAATPKSIPLYFFLSFDEYFLLVIQVENKLRSLLLGHNGPRVEDNRNVSSENKSK